MTTIYKYEIKITNVQSILMPYDAQILTVQNQLDKTYIWAIVNPDNIEISTTIEIFGMGHEMDMSKKRKYIGTVQQNEGKLIWHVFERLSY